MRSVFRALAPDGAPHWVWQKGTVYQDLTEAGLQDSLSEISQWILNSDLQHALLEQAPLCDPTNWPRLQPGRPGKALALGKNFAAHAREFGAEPPKEPMWFAKLPDVLIGPGEPVVIPTWLNSRVDPEAEVVLLLGRDLHQATEQEAAESVAAYTLGNDLTARNLQGKDRKLGHPWVRCKNLPTFGPLGPAWFLAEDIQLAECELIGKIDGVIQQKASLADLLFPPAVALAEISRWTPLCAGDILFLGTPEGVGPVHPGQIMEVSVSGWGVLKNPVISSVP